MSSPGNRTFSAIARSLETYSGLGSEGWGFGRLLHSAGPTDHPETLIVGQPVNIEFRLPKVIMGSISARVIGPEGFQLDRFELSQSDQSMQALDGAFARVDNLRERRYLLHALGSAGGKQYAGFKQVDVSDGDVQHWPFDSLRSLRAFDQSNGSP